MRENAKKKIQDKEVISSCCKLKGLDFYRVYGDLTMI